MSDYVKRLPPGALPEGGVASWSAADAERWRKARVPVVFAPAAGSWVLLLLVAVSYVLTGGFSILRWSGGGSAHGGTHWLGYPAVVLLAALPLWYRYLPVPTVPATVVVAADAAVSLASPDVLDADGRLAASGYFLALVASAWAFTGACLRLRARRKQRALALAAAGRHRHELPDGVPETDDYRGYRQFYLGLVLCLIAGAILTDGLVEDLTAPDRAPYDAVGQQIAALLFLVPGTIVYGYGHVAFRAARRLHEQPQPALMVGVRIAPDGYHWLYPDASATTSGQPLIAYFPKGRDTDRTARLLGTSSTYRPDDGHYDIDPRSEPFEAVLYGAPWEGAEVALEYAVIERKAYQGPEHTYAGVTVAPLLPRRRHGLGPWQPADGAARDAARREKIRKEEQEKRERDEWWAANLRQQEWTYRARGTGRPRGSGARGQRYGRPDSWGGGDGCGGGHSCGGHSSGGHGCGGHGCGGHGCGGD
ncbi:hypothetical protein [Streptomyces noursei]|uniref:hypothetical protein n=1 Tax=Streptomyces noursei TaxID=1971 RepID=UPI000C9A008D|nr:hypothetical protein [Streptomyces noursei]